MSQTDFEIGYRGATACAAAGITYRQLDYWARTALVEPSIRSAAVANFEVSLTHEGELISINY